MYSSGMPMTCFYLVPMEYSPFFCTRLTPRFEGRVAYFCSGSVR